MKIVVFAPDTPYPAVRGGRADIWRRIQAFKALGHQVMLVNLFEPAGLLASTQSHLKDIDAVVDARFSFPIKRSVGLTVRQLLAARSLPWHAATRVPTSTESLDLSDRLRAFTPDVLWLEGPWFGQLARATRMALGVPLYYRSHNIEFKYLRQQAEVAVSWRNKLAWRLACIGLERYEAELMQQADRVFDISMDDLQYWKGRGVRNAVWLPPLPDLALRAWPFERVKSDLLFLGNLQTPNNLSGLNWLIRDVMPLVLAQRPEVKLTVVGSNPSPAVQAALLAAPCIELHRDVSDVAPYLLGAKVLVNPVAVGSGVQLKTLDMLMTDAPIVTHPQGLRGLPSQCAGLMHVASDCAGFATAILSAMSGPATNLAERSSMRARFTKAAVARALSDNASDEVSHEA